MSYALDATDVSISFGGVKALDKVSLTLRQGAWTGLVGPNGSGKTTLLNVLSGIYTAESGEIHVAGIELRRSRPARRAKAGIVRTFQQPQLAPTLTIEENVLLGLDLRKRRGLAYPSKVESDRAVSTLLATFGCANYARHLPAQAPYGVRKMSELARAVSAGPSVLLLDEPAAGLSGEERKELVDALANVREVEPSMSVCLVEHDIRLVTAACTRMEVLNFGKVIAAGTAEDVLSHPEVRAAYLGRSGRSSLEVSPR